ncbi:MAG: hypothetical protein Q8O33_16030 [Pseudomonadota bacterium]|nr:hypothetical protein [Pseudomonadota bacterium]
MTTQTPEKLQELVDELREIQVQMLESLDQAKALIKQSGQEMTLQRAESYWLAHARIALTNDHAYLGGSMCSMEDTIAEIEAATKEEDGED